MSGTSKNSLPAFGPIATSRLSLMGIRFVNDADTSGAGAGAGGSGGDSYTPPATQADLDRIISERVNRTKDQFKDFDAFKTKAEKFDQLQTAGIQGGQQGDDITQRLTAFEQRVTAAESTATETATKLADTELKLARSEVALEKGIAKDDMFLLTATTVDDLNKQADAIKRLAGGSGRTPGQGGATGGGSGVTGIEAGKTAYQERHKKN